MRSLKISCDTHGRVEWQSHIICGCSRTYHVHLVGEPCTCGFEAPDVCECGEDLKETALAICPTCFAATRSTKESA